mgnify:CR=1 FL=1
MNKQDEDRIVRALWRAEQINKTMTDPAGSSDLFSTIIYIVLGAWLAGAFLVS